MNFHGVETFLAIAETGSISLAAEKLFLSQTTAGYRLKSLEDDLGIILVNRKKGQRTIELTPKGSDFVIIANRWMALWKDTQNLIKQENSLNLTIGCVDSLNTYIFPPLYKQILQHDPPVIFKVNTFHSMEIHDLLENRMIDIGYVFSHKQHSNIISKVVYKEPMCVITRGDSIYPGQTINPNQLDTSNEIFLSWGTDYQRWHDSVWAPHLKHYIHVNTASMIFRYFDSDKTWAIAPLSVINTFKVNNDVKVYTIEDDVPIHTCYQITHQFPRPSHVAAISLFESLLKEFLLANENFREINVQY
jgi:DNA-binding transcriptional LysR family regulator